MELPKEIKDLPKEVKDKLLERLESNPSVAKLRNEYRAALGRRNYITATMLLMRIDEEKVKLLKECYSKYEGEVVKVGDIRSRMKNEDFEEIVVQTNAIVMCCDIIEILVMDFEQIYHKYEPTGKVIMYDKLIELGKAAKEHVRMLNGRIDDFYLCNFGDTSDDMHDMLVNKVKKLIRKVDEHELKHHKAK